MAASLRVQDRVHGLEAIVEQVQGRNHLGVIRLGNISSIMRNS